MAKRQTRVTQEERALAAEPDVQLRLWLAVPGDDV